MRHSIEVRLKLATILLTLVGFFALATTFHYGSWIVLIPLTAIFFMPIGEWLDARFVAYRYVTSAITLVYILAFLFIVRQFTLLDAVLSLVMFIQVHSLVHLKEPRNYAYIFLMTFFLLLAASVMSPRAGIALAFVLFVIGIAWSLTLLEMYSGSRQQSPEAEHRVRLRSPGGSVARVDESAPFGYRFAMVLGVMVAGVIGLTGLLFFVGPRTEAGVLGASDAPAQFTTGVSTEVDLAAGGVLQANRGPVMRVQFPEEPHGQYNGPMLWRTTTLDEYTGSTWTRQGLQTPYSMADSNLGELRRFQSDYRVVSREGLERRAIGGGRMVFQEIFLDRPPDTGVPALQIVKTIVPGEENPNVQFRWDLYGDFTVVMSSGSESGVYYKAWSEVMTPSARDLREAGTDYLSVMSAIDYQHLTYENLYASTTSLVHSLTDDKRTAYDKIIALRQFLSGGTFEYTLDVPDLPEDHPVDAFILNVRQGHCELYASALALMVRSLGIPARLVSGYRGGTWDEADRAYTITNDMAHVWMEAYFPGVGWITFDPSPRSAEPDAFSLQSLRRSYYRYLLKARMVWLRRVVGYRPGDSAVMFRETAARVFRTVGDMWGVFALPDSDAPVARYVRGPLLALPVLLAAIGIALFLRRARLGAGQRYRVALTPDQKRAVDLHRLIARRFRRLGVESEGRTAEELSEAVAHLRVNEPALAREILTVYNAVRFGHRTFPPDAYTEWKAKVNRLHLLPES